MGLFFRVCKGAHSLDNFDLTIRKTIEGLGFELWGLESSRGRSELQIRISHRPTKRVKIKDAKQFGAKLMMYFG